MKLPQIVLAPAYSVANVPSPDIAMTTVPPSCTGCWPRNRTTSATNTNATNPIEMLETPEAFAAMLRQWR